MDELLFKHPILKIIKRTTVIDGKNVARTVVDMPDAVMVIAIDGKNNVHYLEEYMAPQEGFLPTFVKGAIDPGEAPEQSATRELAEELGMHPKKIGLLLTLDDRPSHLTTKTHIFAATGCTKLENAPQGDEEDGTLRKVSMPFDQLLKKRSDVFSCARCVAALAELALQDKLK